VGPADPESLRLIRVTRECLHRGIAAVGPGRPLSDIGAAIEAHAGAHGYGVVRAFVGHGIGRQFHEPPQVSHVGKRGQGMRLRAGMCFTIEPMINLGSHEVEILDDKWTVLTADRSLSAQFEHQIVVTKNGCEVLTRRNRSLANSEIFGDVFSVAAAAGTP